MDWWLTLSLKGETRWGVRGLLKVSLQEDGLFRVTIKRWPLKHRFNGTMSGCDAPKCALKNGAYLELFWEYFISKMKIGDRFFLLGEIWTGSGQKMCLCKSLWEKKQKNVVKLDGCPNVTSSKLAWENQRMLEDYNKGSVGVKRD